jgi:hypothetical protein
LGLVEKYPLSKSSNPTIIPKGNAPRTGDIRRGHSRGDREAAPARLSLGGKRTQAPSAAVGWGFVFVFRFLVLVMLGLFGDAWFVCVFDNLPSDWLRPAWWCVIGSRFVS